MGIVGEMRVEGGANVSEQLHGWTQLSGTVLIVIATQYLIFWG